MMRGPNVRNDKKVSYKNNRRIGEENGGNLYFRRFFVEICSCIWLADALCNALK